jgi:enoyl-CoA hydratase
LTGTRIGAADAMYCGLFTHFVPQERFEEMIDALAEGQVEEVLARHAGDPGGAQLEGLRPAIDHCFDRSSVEAIVVALREHEAPFGRAALAAMERASPASLKIVFRQLGQGAGMDIEQALALEYRIIHHLLAGEDFYEGVRSVVIDKDRNPRWSFASLEQVSEAEVERHFESLGAGELALP